MNLNEIEKYKIFECISGSQAYGTNTEKSDEDIRGIFSYPKDKLISLFDYPDNVSDETNDITFYELKKFFNLAAKSNPNIIELLWLPEDCIKKSSPQMELILKNRDLFISKKAYNSFIGYSIDQIKKARGQNKWVNNPKPEEKPDKMDFCWFLDVLSDVSDVMLKDQSEAFSSEVLEENIKQNKFPLRPKKVKDCEDLMGLAYHKAAKVEHTNIYRLYIDAMSGGVFQGSNKDLKLSSIKKEEEWHNFSGLLIFNEQAYEKELSDWENYWDWIKNRNPDRYKNQEEGITDYDTKNLMHCVRLLYSVKNILEGKGPIVRFEGEKLEFLMNIRNGEYSFDELMEIVDEENHQLELLKQKSKVPESVDMEKINDLYIKVLNCEK
jgi:predicted nucleotidyltransferase